MLAPVHQRRRPRNESEKVGASLIETIAMMRLSRATQTHSAAEPRGQKRVGVLELRASGASTSFPVRQPMVKRSRWLNRQPATRRLEKGWVRNRHWRDQKQVG